MEREERQRVKGVSDEVSGWAKRAAKLVNGRQQGGLGHVVSRRHGESTFVDVARGRAGAFLELSERYAR